MSAVDLVRQHPKAAAGIAAGVLALATPVVIHFEGTRMIPYLDPIGVVTVCTGHTKSARLGNPKTPAECLQLLRADFDEHWQGIRRCTVSSTAISDAEWAAHLSFAFNVGVGNFCSSTLAKRLNSGDRAGACAELSRWTMAGGKVLPGLVRRRAEERKLCESGLRPASLGARG